MDVTMVNIGILELSMKWYNMRILGVFVIKNVITLYLPIAV